MPSFAVTVVGDDRPGIVAAVTAALAGLGGNLEDSSMTILRGRFAMTLILAAPSDPQTVRDALEPVAAQLRVHVDVSEVGAEPAPVPPGRHYVLSLHGADRPGIVAAVTRVVAARGGNITDLTTRLTADLYVLVCEVDVPGSGDIPALEAELARLGTDLGVHVSLRTADAELL